jgi:hypothetical protein
MKYGSLLKSIVSSASLRKRSRLSTAVCDAEANPAEPTFEPPRPSNDILFFFFFFFPGKALIQN